jgi:type II secretory pathway component PulF
MHYFDDPAVKVISVSEMSGYLEKVLSDFFKFRIGYHLP